ncbi:MAG: toll/interleukin-1 receptor domain-containing protein [Deltaproteobacteria bacterium]|nr:toll/interleukin-1 receptor domain-containing protein [Deltaproteobacteria bacterium]
MSLRTLYLQANFSIRGRSCLLGRKLFEQFNAISDDCLLGHLVWPHGDDIHLADSLCRDDFIPERLFRQLTPNLIYIEEGLFCTYNNKRTWRIPEATARQFVRDGGVLVVSDVSRTLLREDKQPYLAAYDFFQTSAYYGQDESDDPAYGWDEKSCWKSGSMIICKRDEMSVSDWLRPVYDDIAEILVGAPVKLISSADILASGNGSSTGTLQRDVWVEPHDFCPFASVAQYGHGFAVLVAGGVSSDRWLQRCPENTQWLTTACEFLVVEADMNRKRWTSHLRSSNTLFLSHRSIDKPFVERISNHLKRRGLGVWFDQDKLVPSQSLVREISNGLETMTHFVLFWSRACIGAPWVERELQAATALLIERNIPILIVRLDDAHVPAIVTDLYRIEASGMEPQAVAAVLVDAVYRLERRIKTERS